MYKNPLNNGNISDNNSLKKQRDYGSIIKKYENKKLQTEPTELQKYYQYLTYQQPILDELNYVAERMRNEDIKTKTDDYNFIEDLKIKREKNMKEISQSEKSIKENRETLFDYASTVKQDDETPVINTDLEIEYQTEPQPQPQIIKNTPITQSLMSDLFGEGDEGSQFDMSIADTVIKEDKFELSKEGEKKSKAKKKREGRKKAKEIKANEIKGNEIKAIEEKSAVKIENAILGKVKRNRAKKELISLTMDKANDVIGQINNEKKEIVKNKSNAVSMANDMVDNLFSETIKNIPEKNKRGRKKKIKN
jgi:hypothetical protein